MTAHMRASAVLALALTTGACIAPHARSSAQLEAPAASPSLLAARAGIAIIGMGGLAGLQRTTVLDSATRHFITVTRGSCNNGCAPLDSASGTLSADDVAHIYAVVQREQVFAMREAYGICDECSDQALFTTAVFANNQSKVITSDRETTPEVLGRLHVAVAEAIRGARGSVRLLPAQFPLAKRVAVEDASDVARRGLGAARQRDRASKSSSLTAAEHGRPRVEPDETEDGMPWLLEHDRHVSRSVVELEQRHALREKFAGRPLEEDPTIHLHT